MGNETHRDVTIGKMICHRAEWGVYSDYTGAIKGIYRAYIGMIRRRAVWGVYRDYTGAMKWIYRGYIGMIRRRAVWGNAHLDG